MCYDVFLVPFVACVVLISEYFKILKHGRAVCTHAHTSCIIRRSQSLSLHLLTCNHISDSRSPPDMASDGVNCFPKFVPIFRWQRYLFWKCSAYLKWPSCSNNESPEFLCVILLELCSRLNTVYQCTVRTLPYVGSL